jgi:hypothetical protein
MGGGATKEVVGDGEGVKIVSEGEDEMIEEGEVAVVVQIG